MKNIFKLIILGLFALSCNSKIKDSETEVVVEKGTEIDDNIKTLKMKEPIIGSWVGYFEDENLENNNEKVIYADEGFGWYRENKINITIERIVKDQVIGHSIVAGNKRPFKGNLKDKKFQVREPGDNKYDGEFNFEIINNKLVGRWTAFNDIDIKNRNYSLEKKTFIYNPNISLEKVSRYIDWNNYKEKKEKIVTEENEIEEWVTKEFSSATESIYLINASNKLLKKEDVENLKKGDLKIIRNTIYARHGYSFKNMPLRVFFDAQSWYIPMQIDIKSNLTRVEKENIKLLLRYEKNAVEYYDYFGRG